MEQDDIKECCYRIICLYQRSKPIQDELEREVESLKAARDEKRNAARGNNAVVGTNVDSPASQPSSPVRQERNGEEGRAGTWRRRARWAGWWVLELVTKVMSAWEGERRRLEATESR